MGSIARELVCHRDTPAGSVDSVTVAIERAIGGELWIRFHVEAPIDSLVLPDPADPDRTDELWKTTCFELFVREPDTAAYRELNFSVSSQWAAYSFDGYRENRSDLEMSCVPDLGNDASDSHFALEARVVLPAPKVDTSLEVGVCAIIEESDGTKSYWALRHPPGKPDFHHADCFALVLAAPD